MTNSLLRAATIPEVVFAPLHDNTASQRLLRLAKQGKLRPLYRGIYTSNFHHFHLYSSKKQAEAASLPSIFKMLSAQLPARRH